MADPVKSATVADLHVVSVNGTAGSAIYDASPSGTAYRVSWASPTSGANTVTAEPVQDVVTPQYLTRGRLVCELNLSYL